MIIEDPYSSERLPLLAPVPESHGESQQHLCKPLVPAPKNKKATRAHHLCQILQFNFYCTCNTITIIEWVFHPDSCCCCRSHLFLYTMQWHKIWDQKFIHQYTCTLIKRRSSLLNPILIQTSFFLPKIHFTFSRYSLPADLLKTFPLNLASNMSAEKTCSTFIINNVSAFQKPTALQKLLKIHSMYELQKKLQHESKPCTMYKKPCTVCCCSSMCQMEGFRV